jgi:hypothetical protein
MNKDNLRHMQNALDKNRSDLAYNITQKAGAELVLNVLRQDVLHPYMRDNIEEFLGGNIANWYNEVWLYIATPKRPFDLKMDMCIKNCAEKLRTDSYWYPDIQEPDDLVFDDLFRLLMGTVNIPLSPETTAMISADDNVLLERNDVKETLQHDERWIGILKQIAKICDGRADESKQVCDSIEEYSIPELKRHLEELQKHRLNFEVFSGLALAFDHQEKQRRGSETKKAMRRGSETKKAMLQIGDMQTLLCRMKQMC